MSQYLILINSDEKAQAKATVEQQKEIMTAYMAYTQDLQKAGVMLGGEALEPSAQGARIQFKEGRRVVTDGPFAEAKEVIGGYYLIDVKTREEAVEWAAKCPGAKHAGVEVRAVRVFPKG
jgi:hypothetical protein